MYGTGDSKGQWNDLPCGNTVGAYVIEYGGTAGESATVSGQTTLTINSTEASGSTYNAFDDKQVYLFIIERIVSTAASFS